MIWLALALALQVAASKQDAYWSARVGGGPGAALGALWKWRLPVSDAGGP